MSLAPVAMPDRQPSPGLTVNLGSNNPFRNRTSTASPINGAFDLSDRRSRPISTNPFLDDSETAALQKAGDMSLTRSQTADSGLSDHAAKLFDNLALDSSVKPTEQRQPPRPENIPTSRSGRGKELPRPPRRPSRDDSNSRRGQKTGPLIDIFADSQESERARDQRRERRERRPRRNSDSSMMERPQRRLDPDEERRRRERRHKEREARHKDDKPRSKRNNRRLDIIDKLDVTSIYGSGLFHHDGPFDACNPHRNRKGSRAAPMQAFPKDSRNMALGGAGPNNSHIDLNQFHGRGDEGYTDFGAPRHKSKGSVNFDPSAKLEPIHGAESMGLGTSTFLDGAPASRAAMQRRQSENEIDTSQSGGLQRKKSLAQKIRGINTRRDPARVTSPGPYTSPVIRSAGSSKVNDKNPFFQDYDEAYDKKGVRIEETKQGEGRPRSVSSPKSIPGLEKRSTDDGISGSNGDAKAGGLGGGIMSRMKSLRRPGKERRPTVGASKQ